VIYSRFFDQSSVFSLCSGLSLHQMFMVFYVVCHINKDPPPPPPMKKYKRYCLLIVKHPMHYILYVRDAHRLAKVPMSLLPYPVIPISPTINN